MQRGQSDCDASSRRHSSQAIRLKKAGAAPGKDGSPMLGQKSTKLPCFGHSRCSAGISFAFVIVVRAVSPFGRPNVGFGVHSVIAVMSLHDRSCTESGINPRSCYVGEVPIAHNRRAAKVGCKRASAYGEMPSPIAAGATKTHCLARGLRRAHEFLSRATRRSWAKGRFQGRPHTLVA